MTANRWAELRQVGFAALDHAAAVRTATDLLALGPGFGDPLLAAVGLADFTAPVGPDTSPVTPGPASSPWTCTPPTASTGPASRACCATP